MSITPLVQATCPGPSDLHEMGIRRVIDGDTLALTATCASSASTQWRSATTDATHADLSPGAFLILHDAVAGVMRNGAGFKLLVGRLSVWIADPFLARFNANPAELKGHQVLVRAWLREYGGTPELDVHAPAALLAQS